MIGLKLKDFQEDAVDFLFNTTTNVNSKDKIVMQSPTGSGKTIILIAYIEKYLTYNKDTIYCWFCPGKGELEEQSKEKMERFSPILKTGDIFNVLNNGFEDGTTYFINWESITKKGNRAISDSERGNLFDKIKKAHNKNMEFIIIIDEEHQNNTSKANDIISAISAKYEIRVSATPVKRSEGEFYEIKEADVITEGLITRSMLINEDLQEVSLDSIEHETDILLEKADEVRKKIAQGYIDHEENVRPLVLVQFPNLNDKMIEYVEEKLKSMGYTYENKLLASWFSEENKKDKNKKSKKLGKINIGNAGEKNSITNNNAEPVFLLFKQALATGWDCPRAKILVKLRENMSETFEIQTLGRLRRMPLAHQYGIDILDCSYLYTFDEKYKLAAQSIGAFETQRVFLKEEPRKITLVKELRNLDGTYVDEKEIRNKLYYYFVQKYNLCSIKIKNKEILENNGYYFGTKLKRYYLTGRYITLKDIAKNEKQYKKMEVEVNTHVHGIDRQHVVDEIKKYTGLNYNKTRQLLETLFLQNFGTKSYKILNLNLKEFYAFIINNQEILKKEMSEFDSLKFHQLEVRKNKKEEFKIPLEEHYRYRLYEKTIKLIKNNVYKGYNSSMITDDFRSMSERLFENYCQNNPNVKYIYKNGDNGHQYLSIVYGTSFQKQKLFYPDYIVQLQNESIWLIETKGGESNGKDKNIDRNVINKFWAFKRFSEENQYNFAFIRDKNEKLYYNNTEYISSMDHENWNIIEKIF